MRSSDGQRANGDYRTRNGGFGVSFKPAAGQRVSVNFDSTATESGLPGLLTLAQMPAACKGVLNAPDAKQ